MELQDKIPSRKVGAGMLAGALSVLLVWAAKEYGGTEIPGEAGSAITTVLTFLVSYFVNE